MINAVCPAVDQAGKPSCRHHGNGLVTGDRMQLVLHLADDELHQTHMTVHQACLHALDGIAADHAARRLQFHLGQLGRFLKECIR